jgi:dTDP-4-amino-4,6-dideoxygalactose transaminase
MDDAEINAAAEVLRSGWITQGPRTSSFEKAFAGFVGAQDACAVSSCTAALHLALLAVGVGPGDVVLTVSHSFIATANSVRHCMAEPVFVDVDLETFNMSPAALEAVLAKDCEQRRNALFYRRAAELARGESPLRFLKPELIGRVAAILPVHQIGMPCDIASITSLASRYGVPVVEDAACAIGSQYSADGGHSWELIGKPHGEAACFSFHPRKILSTGDGGMITTSAHRQYDDRLRLLRQHGMSVPDIVRHGSKELVIESYLCTAYNYRLTDIQAGIGIEQLKKIPQFLFRRRQLDLLYREHLGAIRWLRMPVEPSYARTNWQSYAVTVTDDAPCTRNEFLQQLIRHGISAKPGIMNAHQEAPYQGGLSSLPNSEKARDHVVLLPMFHELTEEDIRSVRRVAEKWSHSG